MKDTHVHTNLSHDGISTMEEYIKAATLKGVDEITFTEHFDKYDDIATDLKTVDLNNYYRNYMMVKFNHFIRVNFGIEIGFQPDMIDIIKKIIETYPFDFVIASLHITCKKDMSKDKSYFEGRTRKEAYDDYFKEMYKITQLYNDEFDVIGHLDYVVRYGGYPEKTIKYSEFGEILDEILITLIKKDKGIELNTSGLRYGLPNMHPNKEILKRYKELNGKIVTIGSDAHRDVDLASDFKLAHEILSECGFNEYAVYHSRKPEFVRIR